jgi:hypothetical protein
MPSSYSPLLGIELIQTGEQSGNWGNTTNNNLGTLLEQAIAQQSNITVSGSSYNLVSTPNGTAYESRSMSLRIIGTLSVSCNVVCPAKQKLYVVRNATTGGQNIVMTTGTGTTVTVANGATAIVYCDGTDVLDPFTAKVNKTGDTMAGQLTLPGGGTGFNAATVNQTVAKAGDTMTGQLNLTATNNTPYDTAGPTIAIRNASTTNNTYAAVALNNAASNSSALLFTEYVGTNASRFSIATNPGTTSTSLASRFTVNSDGSFTFYNNSAQVIAALDASGNLSVKGNVTAFAPI